MTDSFVFYRSFMEALELVSEEEYAGCVRAILEYAFNGNEIASTPMEAIVLTLVKPQIDANRKRRKDGEKGKTYGALGGRPKKKTPQEETKNPIGVIDENPTGVTGETPNVNVNDNVNVNVNNKKIRRFSAPSVEEVREYCTERNNNVDPESFVAFYESKGWKVGNTPMKSWKSAVITWEKRQKPQTRKEQYFTAGKHDNDGTDDLKRKIIAMAESG